MIARLAKRCIPSDKIAEEIMNFGSFDGAVGSYPIVSSAGDQFFELPLVVREITQDGFKS